MQNGPHALVHDAFIANYAPSGPLPELAISLTIQPRGPAPRSPPHQSEVDMWFNEVVLGLQRGGRVEE